MKYISHELNKLHNRPFKPVLGQTSSNSEAISRAVERYEKPGDLVIDRYALYSSIKPKDLESQLQKEVQLQSYMTGGMVTTIFINKRTIRKDKLKNYIKKCFDANIELFNFIDPSIEETAY